MIYEEQQPQVLEGWLDNIMFKLKSWVSPCNIKKVRLDVRESSLKGRIIDVRVTKIVFNWLRKCNRITQMYGY